jgi:hypothetical protein
MDHPANKPDMKQVIGRKPESSLPQLLCETHKKVEIICSDQDTKEYPGISQATIQVLSQVQISPRVDDKQNHEAGHGKKKHEFEGDHCLVRDKRAGEYHTNI